MSKFLLGAVVFSLVLIAAAVPARAQIYAPDRGPIQIGASYEYQTHSGFGRTFHNQGVDENFAFRITDVVASGGWDITGALEGIAAEGYDGHTTGKPSFSAKSVFFGGGPRLMLESNSRFEPWVHLLIGLQHYRFTQGVTLGSNSAFGFRAGGGVDIKLVPHFSWRVQADYLAAHFNTMQSNYSVGTGIVVDF